MFGFDVNDGGGGLGVGGSGKQRQNEGGGEHVGEKKRERKKKGVRGCCEQFEVRPKSDHLTITLTHL